MSNQSEQPFIEGRLYRVNHNGDLGFSGDVNHLIDKTVEFVRFTKGGLAEVRFEGKLFYLPRRNLDEIEGGVALNCLSHSDLPVGNPLRGLAEDATPEEQQAASGAITKLVSQQSAQPFVEDRLDGTDPQDDLFVSIGDLSTTRLDGVQIDANQEEMVEDYIEGFNAMVIQGMPPVKALFAMAQAFGLTLGYAIRCGLHPADGRKLLGMLIQQSKAESENVKIVTTSTVQ